jgi:hypothetical protein
MEDERNAFSSAAPLLRRRLRRRLVQPVVDALDHRAAVGVDQAALDILEGLSPKGFVGRMGLLAVRGFVPFVGQARLALVLARADGVGARFRSAHQGLLQ